MEVAERITQQRHRLGLERKQAAHRIGIDYQYLYKLEEGVNKPPTWDTLVKLANGLQCSVDYLLGLTDDPTPVDKRSELTSEERAAAELIAAIPAEKRGAALAVFKAATELATVQSEISQTVGAREGGGVAVDSSPELDEQLRAEKDTMLALLDKMLPESVARELRELVEAGHVLTDADLNRFFNAAGQQPGGQQFELLNHEDPVTST